MKHKWVLTPFQIYLIMLSLTLTGICPAVNASDQDFDLNKEFLSYSPNKALVAVRTPFDEQPNIRSADGKIYRAWRQRDESTTTLLRSEDLSIVKIFSPPISPCWSPDSNFLLMKRLTLLNRTKAASVHKIASTFTTLKREAGKLG